MKENYQAESLRNALSSGTVNGFICESCNRMTEKVHRCSRCESKLYCSAECLDDDWKLVHKKMCKEYVKDGTKKTFDKTTRKAIIFDGQARRDFNDDV